MPDQHPVVSPVDLGAGGLLAWKIIAWQRNPLCMACGRSTALVTPIAPDRAGGWVVAGHLPPDGATVEDNPFSEIRREHVLLCWQCHTADDALGRIAEAVDVPTSCAVLDCVGAVNNEWGFCKRHWLQLAMPARQELRQVGWALTQARRRYLDCRGDWDEVVSISRRHIDLAGRRAVDLAAAEPAHREAQTRRQAESKARRAEQEARMGVLRAGSPVRARRTTAIKVKAGRPQVVEKGMVGVVAHAQTAGKVGKRRPIAVEWTFPTGRKRVYPVEPELLEPLGAQEPTPAAEPRPALAAGADEAVGRGWTYEDAVTDALARLDVRPRSVEVEIIDDDDGGRTVVRVRADARRLPEAPGT